MASAAEATCKSRIQHSNLLGRLFVCSGVYLFPVAEEVTIMSSTTFRKRALAPSGGVSEASTASCASGRASEAQGGESVNAGVR